MVGSKDSSEDEDSDSDEDWKDAPDYDLENVTLFNHDSLKPPTPDSYCVATHRCSAFQFCLISSFFFVLNFCFKDMKPIW